MLKANIYNDTTTHEGVFCVNVSINHIVSDLSISDFMFESVSGDIDNIILPDDVSINYVGRQTLCVILIEVPDDVIGSFRISMRDRQYTVDNDRYGISPEAIDVPDTEQYRIECSPKVFNYVGD